MRKKRKGLLIMNISPKTHIRIKLLAIAEDKFMYQLVEELLILGLEQYRILDEKELESIRSKSD